MQAIMRKNGRSVKSPNRSMRLAYAKVITKQLSNESTRLPKIYESRLEIPESEYSNSAEMEKRVLELVRKLHQ